jgi:hypothetical protein
MGLRTQQLKGLNGGLNAVAQDLEGLEGPTQSPDLLNCYGLPGTVFSRLGSAPWWDTGGTGPLYWFSFFEPLKLGDGAGTTIDGDGWHWPTAPTYPGPVPRRSSYLFRILTPANGTLGVDPDAVLNITWDRRRGAQGYKVQIKNTDTGIEAWQFGNQKVNAINVPAGTLERSKQYTIKVWAIIGTYGSGGTPQLEQTTNTRTFNTLLTVPTNLAPVGAITTLTPTFTCDAVVKAVRYKVKIYDAAGTTVLHTSIALLLPSYVLGGGVLTDYATKYWSFTAYADAACTAAYGVESGHEIIYQIQLDDTLADGTVGTAYTGTITATGGTSPYTYAVTSGTLPAGLSLSSGGAVTGTPTTAATSAFTVTATDANGSTGSRAYSVTVASDLILAYLDLRNTNFPTTKVPADAQPAINGSTPFYFENSSWSGETDAGLLPRDYDGGEFTIRGNQIASAGGYRYPIGFAPGDIWQFAIIKSSSGEAWYNGPSRITSPHGFGVYTAVSGATGTVEFTETPNAWDGS